MAVETTPDFAAIALSRFDYRVQVREREREREIGRERVGGLERE